MKVRTTKTIGLAALAILLPVLLWQPAWAGDVIDRIVAMVNSRIILQSDWDEALCYEALLNGRALSQFSDEDRRAVLDRLIDQELLREQMKSSDFQHASETEAASRIAEARKQYPEAGTPAGWQTLLAKYHLTEKGMLSRVQQQLDLMRLVDARLRPSVQIDSKSIEAYYRDKFVPHLRQSGAGEVPLADVFGRIRELLTEEKVNELLVSWLHNLRSESNVRIPGEAATSAEGAQTR